MSKTHTNTLKYFDTILNVSKQIFLEKLRDYGPSWLILRWDSLVDQVWIKAKRIRKLEENDEDMLIPEGREVEYIGIINYSIVALMRMGFKDKLPDGDKILSYRFEIKEIDINSINQMYEYIIQRVRDLLIKKNHDYGEAWKEMKITSITDQILVKLLRIKKTIESNKEPKASEGIDAQFCDIINYCVFALIKLFESKAVQKEDLFEYCRFCFPPDKNRILLRSKNFYIMLSLGPIVEGYLLIIPYKHFKCFGEIPKDIINEFILIKRFIINNLKRVYNAKRVIFYEHGRVATSIGLLPNDFHAHIHCIPLTTKCNLVEEIKKDLNIGYIAYKKFEDFWKDYDLHYKNRPYLYIDDGSRHYCFYVRDKALRPQYFRYMLAKCLGIEEKYANWMEYPQWEKILKAKILLQPHFLKWRDEI